jgi:hypothetical protein
MPRWQDLHAQYEDMPKEQKATIDAAFDAAIEKLQEGCFLTAMDDRAEWLIAALIHYINESVR